MGLSTSPVIYKSGDNIVCIQAWIPMTFNRVNFIFIWYYEFCLILFTLLLSLKCLSNFTGTGPSLVIAATCLSSMKTSLWLQKVYLQQLGDICIWLGIMAGNSHTESCSFGFNEHKLQLAIKELLQLNNTANNLCSSNLFCLGGLMDTG